MKKDVRKTIQVLLTLDEEEARWLRGYMQNPQVPLEEEDPYHKEMRQKFFDACNIEESSSHTQWAVPEPPPLRTVKH